MDRYDRSKIVHLDFVLLLNDSLVTTTSGMYHYTPGDPSRSAVGSCAGASFSFVKLSSCVFSFFPVALHQL